jgi:hypothetical protein
VNTTLTSLYALDKAKATAETRGKTRIALAEDDGKYATIGLKPNRDCSGIREYFWRVGDQKREES